jgi:iron(III) transport system permease protein
LELTSERVRPLEPAPTEPEAPRRPPRRRGPGRRLPGSTVLGIVIALAIVAPLLVVPLSLIGDGFAFDPIARTLLPTAVRNSVLLAAGVGAISLLVGGGLAVLVSFYDFPGRRWLDWALVLPMAMPSYVLVYVILGQYGLASPLQSNLLGDGFRLPGIRSLGGAVLVLSAVLYPYVYLLARSALVGQSRQSIEAARSLGYGYGGAIWRVAVPLARPALAAGTALVVMEALADFGTVNLLGVQALTSAVYRVWNGGFDESAALQLASVLVALALVLLLVERVLRGRARYHQAVGRGDAVVPRRLRGWRGWLAALPGVVLLLVVFALPVAQLVAWSLETAAEGGLGVDLRTAITNTLLVATLATLAAVVTGTIVAYGLRARSTRLGRVSARLSTIGYAIPGTVVAVAVYVPLVWVDRHVVTAANDAFGWSVGLLFTGTVLGLVLAYVVRFHALSFFSVESRMTRINPNLDDAARSLGADHTRVLADVHLPLLRPGIVTAALLVLVDVMKELPVTALLRPLGRDTLAITVWEATKDSRIDVAALPALLIVLVGLVPVIVLVRLRQTEGGAAATLP